MHVNSELQQHATPKEKALFKISTLKICECYLTCIHHNVERGIQVPQVAHPIPLQPFEHLQMDFIELTPSKGIKYCLAMVDMYSKWVEAFPT